jgi:hypothetical protein
LVQSAAAAAEEKDPVAHCWQPCAADVFPIPSPKFPMAQLVQTDCPDPVLYVPSAHEVQVCASEALLYDPAKQFEQSAAPAAL